jgi:hypothetical protein
MDKTTMVNFDIDRGARIIEALDRAKVKTGVALWAYLSEYDDWRLILSGRQFDSPDLRDAFRLLHESLAPSGLTAQQTPPILILPTRDRFVRDLRRIFGKTRSTEGMRLGNQMIGDRFVEDAYVYRIAP